ncbi:MAG TPA: cupin domain-containing protein [Ruminiclostridium sp.]
MFRKKTEMEHETAENCHGGSGKFEMYNVLKSEDGDVGILFMHEDFLEPGTIFAEHLHADCEEIYYVVEGKCTMIMDGKQYSMETGDVSLVNIGHTHGIINSGSSISRLLVVGVAKK